MVSGLDQMGPFRWDKVSKCTSAVSELVVDMSTNRSVSMGRKTAPDLSDGREPDTCGNRLDTKDGAMQQEVRGPEATDVKLAGE